MVKNRLNLNFKSTMLIIVSFGFISCGETSSSSNNTPVAQVQKVNVINTQQPKKITLSGTDKDGDKLTYKITLNPSHGKVTLKKNIATYKPALNYIGSDKFSFNVNDGKVNSSSAEVSITVKAPNKLKSLAKIKAYAEDNSNPVPLLQDYLNIGVVGVTRENLKDVNALVSTKTAVEVNNLTKLNSLVSIVNNPPVNQAPIAIPSSVSFAENSTNNSVILAGSDTNGDSLTYTIRKQPTHGTLSLTGHTVLYSPTANFSGLDSFSFSVNDGTTDSAPAMVNITVVEHIDPVVGKPWDHGNLEISSDKRMLQHSDGTGFFWLADTVWFAPARMTREEMDAYLTNRAEKGFTVVQVNIMSLTWHRNAYGDFPYPVVWDDDVKDENGTIIHHADNSEAFKIDQFNIVNGTALPEEDYNRTLADYISSPLDHDERLAYIKKFEDDEYDYWDNVAYMIDKAEEKGIYIAMVVAWGGHVKDFIKADEGLYRKYVKNLTDLFKSKPNLIWLNGGDVYDPALMNKPQWNWIGEELKAQDSNHLVSFHGNPSSNVFHDKSWLDFNIVESGHGIELVEQNRHILKDYAKTPIKPTIDAETRYEEMTPPIGDNVVRTKEERIKAGDVREIEYYQLFSGAFGVTYGHNSVWQVSWKDDVAKTGEEGYAVRIHPLQAWDQSLDSDGAFDMQHLGELMKSRPVLGRVPDQSLIVNRDATTSVATRGDGYAMVYSTSGKEIEIALEKVSGSSLNIWSFDPQTGLAKVLESAYPNSGTYKFTPENGWDWVIVIDDASKNYGTPGA